MAQVERRKGTWGTPLSICLLTATLAIMGYLGVDVLNSVRDSIHELKIDNDSAHDKLWQAISLYGKKSDCLAQVVHRCCPNDVTICL
jgi:hypothetical protein